MKITKNRFFVLESVDSYDRKSRVLHCRLSNYGSYATSSDTPKVRKMLAKQFREAAKVLES